MFFIQWTSSNQNHFIFLFSKLVESKAVVSVFFSKTSESRSKNFLRKLVNKELEFSVLLLLRHPRVIVLQ